jgi:hypothetical protein
MMNNCANPKCSKPLHYLREGRIFVFDVVAPVAPEGRRGHRLEHYWLCGPCAETLQLEQTSDHRIKLSPRRSLGPARARTPLIDSAMAS